MEDWLYAYNCVVDGDTIYATSGNRISLLADMDESGNIVSFTLCDNGSVILDLRADEYRELSRVLGMMSGEQLRRSVDFVRSIRTDNKEVK